MPMIYTADGRSVWLPDAAYREYDQLAQAYGVYEAQRRILLGPSRPASPQPPAEERSMPTYKEKPVTLEGVRKFNDRINLIGIELEGGFAKLPEGVKLVRDSSVQFSQDEILKHGLSGATIGELPSPPLEIADWKKWIKKYYPTCSNATCGMHVHMSFKTPFAYNKLMVEKYPATIVAYVKRWSEENSLPKDHPIWSRLAGKCEYCQHVFNPDLQLQNRNKDYDHHRDGNRYSAIAFHYNRLRTIECRLLPMMSSVDLAISAIQNIMDTTNKFLVATASKEVKYVSKLYDSDDEYVETRRIRV